MLANSLFLDFLYDNGLNVWKGESTRDIISISFDYGSRGYDQEVAHLNKLLKDADTDERRNRLQELIAAAEGNKDKYDKKSKQEIREIFYRDGVNVRYDTHNKSGGIVRSDTIHYRMLYRTPGKAKKGECVFCCDRIFDKAREFLYMGITLPEDNAPIVEIGAYSSLITSSIVGRIGIPPEDILILDDVEVPFMTNIVSVEINAFNECIAVHRDGYQLKNTLFDGQALIDSSIFPSWADGYVLLRHHMTKCAAFCANIQLYFKDYCAERSIDYETFQLPDKWGNLHLAKNIKLISTTNAVKWVKFNVSYEEWCKWVHKNGCLFGVVKTAHESKLGEVQRMSYQMVNTLGIDTMYSVMQPTVEYIQKLQSDETEFLEYLRRNENFSNDFDVLIALVDQNPEFTRSEYYRERKKTIIGAYVRNMKTGKLIQNADNLVIVGSIYGMLMHSVGLDPRDDPTFEQEDGVIQCYTGRFRDGEYLASFRSPHNSANNIGYLHNHYHEYFEKYFQLGKQIIVINLNGSDFQDRSNGSDQDSDAVFVTNQPDIVVHASYCYKGYPTIVNNIPKESKTYTNTVENYSAIDNRLAASQTDIGESSNLAAICLAYGYTYQDNKYWDYACILSVIAQAAIDSSKRQYIVDIPKEIKRIKKDMDIKENGYPVFWRCIRPEFQGEINKALKCPMNEVSRFRLSRYHYESTAIPNSEFFIKYESKQNRRKCKRVEALIQKYSMELANYNREDIDDNEDYLLLRQDFENMIADIRQTYISNNYLGLMSWLIDRALRITPTMIQNAETMHTNLNKNRALLLKTLYTISPEQFLQCFKRCTPSKIGA